MPKLARSASKEAKQERVHEELHKFKHGELHSGSKEGPIVTNPAQAKAIAMSESGQSKYDKKRKANRKASRGGRR